MCRILHFELGQKTIFTLEDELILQKNDANVTVQNSTIDNVLKNINLAENKRSAQNISKEHVVEVSMGRSGRYVGNDDDEFEELGGSGQQKS